MIQITNHGPLILSSNYWDSDLARAGKVWCSVNAGAVRPGFPFSMGMTIDSAHVKAERSLTPTYPTVGSLFDAAIAVQNAAVLARVTYVEPDRPDSTSLLALAGAGLQTLVQDR